MSSIRAIVTGGTGFIGSHLVKQFCQRGYEVYVPIRESSNLSRLESVADRVIFFNFDELDFIFKKQIHTVLHLATEYGRKEEGFSSVVETNVLFGLKLLDKCIQCNVELFINTDSFFNDESSPSTYMQKYTLSKRHFLDWLQIAKYKINIVNMKLHHVFGPYDNNDKFIPWLIDQLLTQDSVDLTSGKQYRDFIYIDDVVSAFLVVIDNPLAHKDSYCSYTVSSGLKTSVRDFCLSLQKKMISDFKIKPAKLNFGKKVTEGEIYDINNDNSCLVNIGWQPEVPLDQGIERVLSFYLEKHSHV